MNELNSNQHKCESLADARKKIDCIDNALIELLAQRQFYVDQAVRFKNSVQDVQAPERVEQVIANVRNKANLQGVDPDLIEKIYREMIQYFIQRELKELRP